MDRVKIRQKRIFNEQGSAVWFRFYLCQPTCQKTGASKIPTIEVLFLSILVFLFEYPAPELMSNIDRLALHCLALAQLLDK